MGTDWDGLEQYLHDVFMPNAGTSTLVPSVCAGPVQSRPQRPGTAHQHDGMTTVPRFLPSDGGQVIALMNGRQTHCFVTFLADNAVRGQRIDLFGYTFDHPEIAESLALAAQRGVIVRLTLNADEVEGNTKTANAVRTIAEMMRQYETGRTIPGGRSSDSLDDWMLEVWKQEGQRCGPVYDRWGRPHNFHGSKRGALHAKVFVIGPATCVTTREDTRMVVLGSTNWTIASECNAELSVALRIGNEGAATVDHVVRDLRCGATKVDYHAMMSLAASHRPRYARG